MINKNIIRPAKTRCLHRTGPNTIRLWTFQPLDVCNGLLEQHTLYVNPTHPRFLADIDNFRDAYEWMREQMKERIPGYQGHYPWWAYDHFPDLRRYRWHTPPYGERLVRLELAIPSEQVILSGYDTWHWVLNRWYLPETFADEPTKASESEVWERGAKLGGVDTFKDNPFAEPWEAQLQASWRHIFDIDSGQPRYTVQANFERLELTQVVKVTEFTSMPEHESR